MRTALVTGAATGIGSAIATRLAADGFALAVADVDRAGAEAKAAALRDAGHEAAAFVADIADEADVDRLAREVLARFGQIDVLVNNAGITGPHGPFATYDRATLRRVIEVDLVGTLLCTQAVLPSMLERREGRIVNLASIAGKDGNPNLAPYAAAKAGVIAFTKSLARELASSGILVHAIAPGGVGGTSITKSAGTPLRDLGAQRTSVLATTPLGRLATPEEVAALASWLCSPDCSYTTGAVHDISGGRATY
ncbi:MAG: SDR family oxidoreductase [Deltaproteobacteria bacterium]|nr:SDR family oxidoreductase [Deltaproteobacteria bacterium]